MLATLASAWMLPSAHAVVLNWDTMTWTSGSLTQSYDIDPTFAGNDIRITISGNTGNFISSTPNINNDLTGGITPAEMSLRLQLDIPNRTNFVTVTIEFLNPSGVLLPTFSLYDIDTGTGASPNFTFQDQVRNIQASFGITPVATSISNLGTVVTASGGNTLTGTASAANNTNAGNATITAIGAPVTQISFDYGGGLNSVANPAQQGIALSDISYNSISGVPEINTVWVALLALLLAGLFHAHRQNQAHRLLTSTSVE